MQWTRRDLIKLFLLIAVCFYITRSCYRLGERNERMKHQFNMGDAGETQCPLNFL